MARGKKRKSRKRDEHIDESWLVPYADILTLLLALFIVLYASSSIDQQKFQEIANSFNHILNGGDAIMEFDNPAPTDIESMSDEEEGTTEQEELAQLQQKINNYIEENELTSTLNTQLTSEGLLVTLQDGALFNSASAKVRPEDMTLARELSELLVLNPPRKIIISGHTDSVPINNEEFDNNWHLSAMRSINFMKVLLENDNLNPSYLSARGLGEYDPVASNETAAGREKNRRVEILILPNVAQATESDS